MAEVSAYMRFNGNCREAMTFYKDCFGGDLTMQAVGETAAATQMSEEESQRIIHSKLSKDGFTLQGSDMLGPEGRIQGNAISLALDTRSEDEINTLFSKLSEGGQVTYPLKVEFWGGTFGIVVDRFGNEWLCNYEAKPQA